MGDLRRTRLRQVAPREPHPPYIGPLAAVACVGFWNRRGQESPPPLSPFLNLFTKVTPRAQSRLRVGLRACLMPPGGAQGVEPRGKF